MDRVAEAKDYAEYVAGRAIAVIAPTIRNKALDDAANVAEIYGANAAKAILALKAP